MNNFGEKVSFIWSVADLLRGPYRPNQYKDVTQMESMGDGVIQSIEIKHGLPFKMTIEEVAA